MKNEPISANTTTPASAQVVLRLNFFDPDVDGYRSIFARVTAFAADYTPHVVTGLACNLSLGDIVSGILERPNSDRNSTALAAWDFATLKDWSHFAPFAVFHAPHFNPLPDDVCDLPQLGGNFFDKENRSFGVATMRIASPMVPNQTMRSISARTGNLSTAAAEIQTLVHATCEGCVCPRCSSARDKNNKDFALKYY